MNFLKRAWRVEFEEGTTTVTGNVYHASLLYAVVIGRTVEEVMAEAQSLVDAAMLEQGISWPPRSGNSPRGIANARATTSQNNNLSSR